MRKTLITNIDVILPINVYLQNNSLLFRLYLEFFVYIVNCWLNLFFIIMWLFCYNWQLVSATHWPRLLMPFHIVWNAILPFPLVLSWVPHLVFVIPSWPKSPRLPLASPCSLNSGVNCGLGIWRPKLSWICYELTLSLCAGYFTFLSFRALFVKWGRWISSFLKPIWALIIWTITLS